MSYLYYKKLWHYLLKNYLHILSSRRYIHPKNYESVKKYLLTVNKSTFLLKKYLIVFKKWTSCFRIKKFIKNDKSVYFVNDSLIKNLTMLEDYRMTVL